MVIKTRFQNKKAASNYIKSLCKKRGSKSISEIYVNSGSEKVNIPAKYEAVGYECLVYELNAKGNSVSRKYTYIAFYNK